MIDDWALRFLPPTWKMECNYKYRRSVGDEKHVLRKYLADPFVSFTTNFCWLVVWNIFFSPYIGNNNPN